MQYIVGDSISFGLERSLSTGNWNVKRFKMNKKGMTQVGFPDTFYTFSSMFIQKLETCSICCITWIFFSQYSSSSRYICVMKPDLSCIYFCVNIYNLLILYCYQI